MSAKTEQATRLLNNINIEAKKIGLGDHVIGGIADLQATVVDKTFAGDNATTSKDGLMSSTDKAKLDDIEAQANNYVLPAATDAAIGGVKQGVAVPDSEEATSPTTDEFNALLASLRTAGVIAS